MTSPRPSLTSSTSVVSGYSSGAEDCEEDGEFPPRPTVPPVPPSGSTKVKVGKVVMPKGAKVPGVVNGAVVNNHLNFFIKHTEDFDPDDVNGFVTDAVKINSESVKSYLPSYNSSSNIIPGTKEDVDKLSRHWFYLICALVALSLITLLATAVLSLSSWRSSHGPTLATQATMAGLSAEERHFAAVAHGPTIVTRTMWLAAPPRNPLDKNTLPVEVVVVCHTATANCSSQPECIETTRAVQRFHQESRHWDDISYNFLIGGDGAVYWGRGFDYMGAHTKGFNNGSIGVAFIGTYVDVVPNSSQKNAFNKLVQVGLKEGKISGNYSLVAQCQLQVTAAPGLALVNDMASWPHFNSTLSIHCTQG